jgi:hypothetical protein
MSNTNTKYVKLAELKKGDVISGTFVSAPENKFNTDQRDLIIRTEEGNVHIFASKGLSQQLMELEPDAGDNLVIEYNGKETFEGKKGVFSKHQVNLIAS